MSCYLPGANNISEFWNNLTAGVISTRKTARWNQSEIVGGFIDHSKTFDAEFFNISPAEALCMSPEMRKLLECSYHAIEDSGLTLADMQQFGTGVFTVSLPGDYKNLIAQNPDYANHPHSFTGNAFSSLSGRLSYAYNLNGPCLSIDSACSSGLHALKIAQLHIQNGDCKIAIVAGASLFSTNEFHDLSNASQMTTQKTSCRPFDGGADGMIPSEGVACLILCSKAVADKLGGKRYAMVDSIKLNHNGTSNGLMSPSVKSQVNLLTSSYQEISDLAPQLALIESHGTSTQLGDQIELQAIMRALDQRVGKTKYKTYIGALKANIGHTLVCSSLVSTIKVILSQQHQLIPPHPSFNQPSSQSQLPDGVAINTKQQPWPDKKNLAGVSAFGFSGSNAHMILNFNIKSIKNKLPSASLNNHFIFCAEDEARMLALIKLYSDWLEKTNEIDLVQLSYRLLFPVKSDKKIRIVIYAERLDQLISTLQNIHTHKTALSNGTVYIADESRQVDIAREVHDWLQGSKLNLQRSGTIQNSCYLPPYPFKQTEYDIGQINHEINPATSTTTPSPLIVSVARILSYSSSQIDSQKTLAELGADSLTILSIQDQLQSAGWTLDQSLSWMSTPLSVIDQTLTRINRSMIKPRTTASSCQSLQWWTMGQSGRPVILMPPLNCDYKVWLRQSKRLHHAGYQVHIPCYPGKDHSNNDFSIDLDTISHEITDYSSRFHQAIDFCGWSLGGVLCQIIAKKSPSLMKSMTLISTATQFNTDLFDETISIQSELEKHQSILQIALQTSFPVQRFISAELPMIVLQQYYDKLLQFEMPASSLAAFSMPTLIVNGACDPVISAEMRQQLSFIPNAKHLLYEKAGHFIPLCQTVTFNRDFIQFLDQCGS